MKLRNSVLFVFLALASCKSQVAFFNHIPADYYTRHHSEEIKTPQRKPAHQRIRQAEKTTISQVAETEREDISKTIVASADNQIAPADFEPLYKRSSYKEPEFDEDTKPVQREKVLEGFGLLSFIFGILSILIPYLIPISVIFAVISLTRHERFPDIFYGKQYATFGLIISGVVLLLYILILLFVLILFAAVI